MPVSSPEAPVLNAGMDHDVSLRKPLGKPIALLLGACLGGMCVKADERE